MDSLDELQGVLGYKFKDITLLQQALTHSTLPTPTSSPFKKQNDLRILGDCVIKLCVCQYSICVSLPNDKVHKIVKIKDNLSNRYCLNLIGKSLQLEEKGLISSNLQPEHIFSNLDTFLKNIFGACFLDAGGTEKKGFISCWKVFLKLWKPVISCFDQIKPLQACFPEPQYSSTEFLRERFSSFKAADLKLLEERIGYRFEKNPHLLEQAMTHDSIDMFRNVVENTDAKKPEFVHFQNLEFLGDSVLELVIMENLYLRSSSFSDPVLGQMLFFNRDTGQKLYSSKFQLYVAKKLQLDQFVIKPPHVGITCHDDFVEALIGACYVHGRLVGLRICAKIVLELWGLELEEEEVNPSTGNQASANSDKAVTTMAKPVTKTTIKPEELNLPGPSSRLSPVVSTRLGVDSGQLKELQALIGYTFKDIKFINYLCLSANIDTNDTERRNLTYIKTSLQTVGKCCVELMVAEYVIGICHSTDTADLSAEMKRSVLKLMEDLTGDDLLKDISAQFQLWKYFSLEDKEKDATKPAEVIHLIFGCLFMDSPDFEIAAALNLFSKFWSSYIKDAVPEMSLVNCFPDTSVQQNKLRAAVNAKITDVMWTKMFKMLGHTFKHKNLLEQALTDEKSQGYSKQCVDAYPTGNPFALQILGKSVCALLIARQGYLNSLDEPVHFSVLQGRLDQSLFNCLKSRLAYLDKYYANHVRYPFPPKKNPRAPYEAILAALYIEAGGKAIGMLKVQKAIILAFPNFITMKKPKAVKEVPANEGTSVECSPSVSVSTDGGKNSGEDLCQPGSYTPDFKFGNNTNVNELLNTSFESRDSPSPAVADGNIPQFFLSMPVLKDPLLAQLQKKIGYTFVNPFLLKIVLEVSVPLGTAPGENQATSTDYFEIFKIVGQRALNLLATEFALESLKVHESLDITYEDKKQVETHRRHLTSSDVTSVIANKLELKKYVFVRPSSSPSYDEHVVALLGAVFIDSRANYLKIAQLFNKLWKSNINSNPQPLLTKCIPNTLEAQANWRARIGSPVSATQWKKLFSKLGYNFKNKNLVEQAFTDEGTQELARTKYNVYPTGNPFALRLIGRCVLELVIAYKTLPTSLSTTFITYVEYLDKIEKGLFNSFKNNFIGIEKYYAWVKAKKNQKFRTNNRAFEALLGAVYVDSGLGNPGCDSVAQVIVNRGVVKVYPVNGGVAFPPASNQVPVVAEPVLARTSTLTTGIPTTASPGGSSSILNNCSIPSTSSESLNSSFSSKCAANFSISPLQQQQNKSTATPLRASHQDNKQISTPKLTKPTPTLNKSPPKANSEASLEQKSQAAAKTSPKTSPPNKPPKKENKKTNGQPIMRTLTGDNKLLQAVTNAQCQIQALKRKQEFIDRQRKISLEKDKVVTAPALTNQQDQASNGSSDSRSRCPSTSTITSVGSQQQNNVVGQKRKRTRRAKKQNKKAKGAGGSVGTVNKQQQVLPTSQQQLNNSSRVSAWCQDQLDNIVPTASSSLLPAQVVASSSCTTNVHQKRSKTSQLQKAGVTDTLSKSNEMPSHFPSPAHSSHGGNVPVNMVSGYRKSEVPSTSSSKAKNGKPQTKGNNTVATGNNDTEDVTTSPPGDSTRISYFGILKCVTVIIGVAFLLKRYTQGR